MICDAEFTIELEPNANAVRCALPRHHRGPHSRWSYAQVPRRNRLDHLVDAERKIYDAIEAVEALGADVRLTDAVVLLGRAKDKVGDVVDGVPR